MLSRMADHHGAVYAETLTGFKWLGQQAIAHDAKPCPVQVALYVCLQRPRAREPMRRQYRKYDEPYQIRSRYAESHACSIAHDQATPAEHPQ